MKIFYKAFFQIGMELKVCMYRKHESQNTISFNLFSDSEDDESDVDEEVAELPSFSQLHSSFNMIRTFMESRNYVPENIFSYLNGCEDFVDGEKWNNQKQMKITSYFKAK